MIKFSWNPTEAKSNLKKHGVSFEEAKSVFYDECAVQFYDEAATDEDRFLLLGLSNNSRVLVVVHCERGEFSEEIRIISARKATKSERQYYEGEALREANMIFPK
ncbi:MAG: BrnT family toxin [Congregibacter sp.]